MSQLPPLVKHPVQVSLTPASSQTGLTTAPANFIPRREFIRDHRPASSFSLLAFSGSNLLRLYSFTAGVVNALRRLFNQKDLISAVREHAPKHFYEFTLEGKPWANPKSISSEKLIVDILTIVFHTGYAFLSTIDYGREHDDKLAIAFSRPVLQSNAPAGFPAMNGSVISLNQPPKTPFAISFSSSTLLRVVGPPLHSTPAILQAVRGAWPRGVVSDKKVGDATYEFKLKGYKWFQEDTFPMDSLNHILGLLTSLDIHGFTLLTQLSFSKPSRLKDFWVFTGTSDEQHTPPSTPTILSPELKRDMSPQSYSVIPGPSPLSSSAERRTPPRPLPTAPVRAGNGDVYNQNGHARTASDSAPVLPSPLKHSTAPFSSLPANLLRRASAKTRIPSAFNPHKLERSHSSGQNNSATTANGELSTPSATAQMARSLSNPSSVGSVDMTGVGRRTVSADRTPDVFYVTDAQHESSPQEFDPFQSSFKPNSQTPHAAFIKVTTPTDRRASMDSRSPYSEQRPSLLRPNMNRSSTIPALDTRQMSGSSAPRVQVHVPSPISAQPSPNSDRTVGRDEDPARVNRAGKQYPQELQLNDRGRTPTPPLLTPGTFRDSAFSWATGKSRDVSIAWTGRGPEPHSSGDKSLNVSREFTAAADTSDESHGLHRFANKLHQPHSGVNGAARPDMNRISTGPLPPGGWSSTPREDKGDVSQSPYKMFPPTIREQPSQEGSDLTTAMSNGTAKHHATRERERGREREVLQKIPERFNVHERHSEVANGDVASSGTSSRARSATVSSAEPLVGTSTSKPKTGRRDTAMSGWVMVNVEGSGSSSQDRPKKSSSQSPPGSRPAMRHKRSNSDSGLLRPQVSKSPVGNAPAPATMSAAAKTIAMIDAVEAKKEETEKSSTPSSFKRMFQRGKGSESEASSRTNTLRRRQPEGALMDGRNLDAEERGDRLGPKDRLRTRGVPPSVKPGSKRISLD